MYIHCTEKKGDLEFVTLDQSIKLIRAKDWHGTTMLAGSELRYAYCLWKETVFKVVFSCAVGLELNFVGGSRSRRQPWKRTTLWSEENINFSCLRLL